MNSMKLRRIVTLLFGLAIVGLIVYAFWPKPLAVDVAEVRRGRIEQTVDEDGRTRIMDRYIVSAPLGGLMKRIDLKPGHTVYAGETILTYIEPTEPSLLDPRAKAEAKARVLATEASIQTAEARIGFAREAAKLAKIELDRNAQLLKTNSVAREAFENAEHKERMARQELRIAESGLQLAHHEKSVAEAALIRTEPRKSSDPQRESFPVISPISGKVLRVFQESAVVATSGMKLIEIGDPTNLEVEIDVLSRDGARIQPGAKVYLEHWGGDKPLEGNVRLVEPSAFLKISALGVEEQRVNVIVDFKDPPKNRESLGDAFRVEARIVIGVSDNVLTVPVGALFRHNGEWAVFVIQNGKTTLRPVKVGRNNGIDAEILEGLEEKDRVVLHPGDRVRDGVAVTPRGESQ
jgi:HlyD family secretion protein